MAASGAGPLADYIRRDGVFSNTFVRRLLTCGGFGVEGGALLALFFLESRDAAVVALSVGVGMGGFTVAGWQINHQDLAPRFAGVVVGLTSTIGNSAGIIAPLVVGALTHVGKERMNEAIRVASAAAAAATSGTSDIATKAIDPADIYWRLYLSGWQLTFLITSIVVFTGAIVYAIWGSGEIQSWAYGEESQILVVDKSKSSEDLFKEEQFKVSKIQQNEPGGARGGGGGERSRGAEGGAEAGAMGGGGGAIEKPQLQLEEEDEVDYEEEKKKDRLSKASFH